MKRNRALVVLVLLTAHSWAAAADPPSFAGTWKLDTSKGANLGMMTAMQSTVIISQTREALVLKESSEFQGQKSERELRYDLAGQPVANPNAMGGSGETVAAWVGDKLVVTWTSEGAVAGTKTIRTETRSLSADGLTMTVESVRGAGKPVVMVYEKTK